MPVNIKSVIPDSPCAVKGICAGYRLLSLNGHEINDVLDYRFYGASNRVHAVFSSPDGHIISGQFKTGGNIDSIGLEFETYLMDKQKACRNHCIFCFVDQMPKGLRKSLYFKDDDIRLSYFFGNYVTMTNMTEEDVRRLVEMRITPVNISLHTMNPDLRVSMLRNPHAGEVLKYLDILKDGGIRFNAQFVLCPGINDGKELLFSLERLYEYKDCLLSAAVVPVGLTGYRSGLDELEEYTPETAKAVIDLTEKFNSDHPLSDGGTFVQVADEFFLKAGLSFPDTDYYGDFPQLENGVGMWTMTRHGWFSKLEETDTVADGNTLLISGVAASKLINSFADKFNLKYPNARIDVLTVVNDFFGHKITVTGLLTGTDIARQAGDLSGYDKVIISDVMLRSREEPVFLDDTTLSWLEEKTRHKFTVVSCNGDDLFSAVAGTGAPGEFKRNIHPHY